MIGKRKRKGRNKKTEGNKTTLKKQQSEKLKKQTDRKIKETLENRSVEDSDDPVIDVDSPVNMRNLTVRYGSLNQEDEA